jgi:hypothetical protein
MTTWVRGVDDTDRLVPLTAIYGKMRAPALWERGRSEPLLVCSRRSSTDTDVAVGENAWRAVLEEVGSAGVLPCRK